ncbi:MAG: TrkA family potassium uptake protein [Clostridia bacterium]|nr:TrkA family potassium uptake protein [Clostridia bacterium]
MKSVLLIGLGRFGRNLAEKLKELGHQVMAVDIREERVNDILGIVTDAQIGDSTSETFLRTLGVNNYDVCFVAIGEDFQSSLETTSLLKELGARKVVARASREVHRKFLLRNGADEVVYPAKQVADWAGLRYTTDHVLDFIALDEEYSIYELAVPAEWAGKTVGGMDIRRKYNLNILTLRGSDGRRMAVDSDTAFYEGQTMFVLGRWKDVQKCFHI